ncbi:MAG: hypothetical protein ACK42E_00670 [Candidatus Bipolaricaulaceae bacterium]
MLVFWVQPAVQKARSPIAEITYPPFVVRYVKTSSIAANVLDIAHRARQQWFEVLQRLGLADFPFPERIYLYVYASREELSLGLSSRIEEELTLSAVTDLVVTERGTGEFARLACSLALGRPGNPVFPRGLSLYFDAPDYPWLAEAGAWLSYVEPRLLWQKAESLLPYDPWESLYFQVNAPWVGAAPTWETMRSLTQVFTWAGGSRGRMWEVLAAAQAQWILHTFGPSGVRAFWKAGSWESASSALGMGAEKLRVDFEAAAQGAFAQSPRAPYFAALCDLYRGRAQTALSQLSGLEGEDVRKLRALAWLALGELSRFCEESFECPPELVSLGKAPKLQQGRWCVVGSEVAEDALRTAVSSAHRLLALWGKDESVLPERVVFYLVQSTPNLQAPWGVVWVHTAQELPDKAARLVLEAFSPYGSSPFSTLVEGLVLWAAYPERDFRAEAQQLLAQERWVSLTQPLFGVYPRPLAEAEAGAFVVFLLEQYGSSAIPKLWEALAKGASIFRASQEVLGAPWSQVEADLLAWLRQP